MTPKEIAELALKKKKSSTGSESPKKLDSKDKKPSYVGISKNVS